jgi:hypothetical protein
MERTEGDGHKIDDSYVLSVSLAHVDTPSSTSKGGGGEGADNDEMGIERGADGAKVTGDDGVTEEGVMEEGMTEDREIKGGLI